MNVRRKIKPKISPLRLATGVLVYQCMTDDDIDPGGVGTTPEAAYTDWRVANWDDGLELVLHEDNHA